MQSCKRTFILWHCVQKYVVKSCFHFYQILKPGILNVRKALQGSVTHRTIHQTYLTCHRVFRCTQLLSQLFHVVWMNLFIQSAAKPFRLWLVQHRSHRIRHVDHSSRLSCNYKQEPICSLQDKMFQFLPKKGFYQNASKKRELNNTSVTAKEYCFLAILVANHSLSRIFPCIPGITTQLNFQQAINC